MSERILKWILAALLFIAASNWIGMAFIDSTLKEILTELRRKK